MSDEHCKCSGVRPDFCDHPSIRHWLTYIVTWGTLFFLGKQLFLSHLHCMLNSLALHAQLPHRQKLCHGQALMLVLLKCALIILFVMPLRQILRKRWSRKTNVNCSSCALLLSICLKGLRSDDGQGIIKKLSN